MYEAAYLRAEDVDLKSGTITITETPYHKPKTEQSYRTIPVCGEALTGLKAIMTEGKVQIASGEVFHDAKGNIWKPNALSKHWQRTLRAAGAAPVRIIRKDGKPLTVGVEGTGISRLSEIPSRKLRAFFATTASQLGASDHALRGYLGHTGDTMLSQHYRAVSSEELLSVASLMNDWRGLIGDGVSKNGSAAVEN